jgi:hypothetical protein
LNFCFKAQESYVQFLLRILHYRELVNGELLVTDEGNLASELGDHHHVFVIFIAPEFKWNQTLSANGR